MKNTKKWVLGAAFAMLLSGCTEPSKPPVTYKLTFHQATVAEDTVFTITEGVTTNSDIVPPEIVDKVDGYDYNWVYDVETMTEDLTIEPQKTAITYTATFYDVYTETVLGKDEFTVEDEALDCPNLPNVPGYTYSWDDLTIEAGNKTVYTERTAQYFTVTFKVDGEVYDEPLSYSVLDLDEDNKLDISNFPNLAALPEEVLNNHLYNDPSWPNPAITELKNLTIELQWTPHVYYAQFLDDKDEELAKVGYTYNGSTATWVDNGEEPEVPEVFGKANGRWEEYTLDASSQIIVVKPEYDVAKFNAKFVKEDGTTQVAVLEFTVDTEELENLPPVPLKYGYHGEWDLSTFDPSKGQDCVIQPAYTEIEFKPFVDFESEDDLALVQVNKGTASIVELDGSHVLKVTPNNQTIDVTLFKDYLDEMFEDTKVKSVKFDAKSDGNHNNFRRVGDITYDNDWADSSTGTSSGVNTIWKTFTFDRDFYENLCTNGGSMIHSESLGTDAVYFDNFKVSSRDTKSNLYQDMEGGTIRKVSDSDIRVYGYSRSSGAFVTSASAYDFYIHGANDSATFEASWSYDIKSQGRRSLKIVHDNVNTVNIDVNIEMAQRAKADGIKIDVLWDGTIAGRDQINYIQVGNGFVNSPNNLFTGKWRTVYITKSYLNGLSGNYATILRLAGSQCDGTFYIDNIRPYYENEGFEDCSLGVSEQNVEVSPINAPNSQFRGGSNRRDYNDHIFYINGAAVVYEEACFTTEYHSEGCKSLKYVHGSNNTTFNIYLNKTLIGDNLDAAGISIDIMTKDGHIDGFGGNQTVEADGQWHTYTITKEVMNSLRASTHYCMAYSTNTPISGCVSTACSAGTYYFDNLVYLNK